METTERLLPQSFICTSSSEELERAIETVRNFGDISLPIVQEFDIEDGALKSKNLPAGRLTLNFLSCLLFPEKRKLWESKRHAIQHTLSSSLDLLKIYSSALADMNRGSDTEKEIATRAFTAVEQFNKQVQHAQEEKSSSIPYMIKKFFLRAAGWSFDEEIIENEIPLGNFYHSHTFTSSLPNTTSTKVASLIQQLPQKATEEICYQQEKELFIMKALTLLTKEKAISSDEISEALLQMRNQRCTVELQRQSDQQMATLRQKLSFFPGETIYISGSFMRDSGNPYKSYPVTDSFHVHFDALQTGFPTALQISSFSWAPRLFTLNLLRPQLAPNISAVAIKQSTLAKQLLPGGPLHSKAKILFKTRQKLWIDHQERLLPQVQKMINSLLGKSSKPLTADYFSQLSTKKQALIHLSEVHEKLVKDLLTKPCEQLEQSLLFGKSKKSIEELCSELFGKARESAKMDPYQEKLSVVLSDTFTAIASIAFSEKLKTAVKPPEENTIRALRSFFNQQLLFIEECELLQVTSPDLENKILERIEMAIAIEERTQTGALPQSVIEHKASDLTTEFIAYFQNRTKEFQS